MKRRFEIHITVLRVFSVLCLMVLMSSGGRAQIPDEFTNLKVLSKDISKQELMGTMRGYASALDVACNHCHVGEDPDSLEGYDFASDEKETKRVARVMIGMTTEINNSFMPKTEREEPVEVSCATCHRGVQRPEPIEKIFLMQAEEEGLEAAIAEYRQLRDKHYGSAAYDFSASSLDGVTEYLAMQRADFAGAKAVNDLNLEFYPDSGYTLFLRARLQFREGDRDGAIATLERAIKHNPDMDWLEKQLEEVKNAPMGPHG